MHPNRGRPYTAMPRLLAQGLLAALLAAVASCASSPATHPQPSSSRSFTKLDWMLQLDPVVVTCLARHGVIPAKDLDSRWYRNGHLYLNQYFSEWWADNNGLPVKVNGRWMHLDDVAFQAVENGTWPVNLCGPLPSPSPSSS